MIIGHASQDEKSDIKNGIAGDQTKREVCVTNWFNRPWNCILRCNDANMRLKIADAMRKACNNDLIGYDQNQRNTLFDIAKKSGYDPSKVTTACETDCSALVALCCMYAGIPENALYINGNSSVTSNLKGRLMSTGKFTTLTDSKFLTSGDYLLEGDILLLEGGHTAVALENGDKVTENIKPTPIATITNKFIDVSKWQGKSVDWNKVKNAGINNVIMRCYHSGKDIYFDQYYSQASALGMNIGAYVFLKSNTVETVTLEMKQALSVVAGHKLPMGFWIDVEDNAFKGIGHTLVDVINTCQKLTEEAGFAFGMYIGYRNVYTPYIEKAGYAKEINCPLWIPSYGANPSMSINDMPNNSYKPVISNELYAWQYSSKTTLAGITENTVDVSILYGQIPLPHSKANKVPTGSSIGSSNNPVNQFVQKGLLDVVNCTALNVREGGGSNFKILQTVKVGEILPTDGTNQNGWYRVKLNNGVIGYVSNMYAKPIAQAFNKEVTVTNCSSLNVRYGTSTATAIVTTVKAKDVLKIDGLVNNNWYHVMTSNGITGYVNGNYITK